MHSVEIARAVRLQSLEEAILSLLRAGQEEGFDAINVSASADDGQVAIDLQYIHAGVPISGQSL